MTFVAAILVASLLGSVHCAAMCGAFVCTYAGQRTDLARNRSAHAAYHAGRLVSYVSLGAVAGTLGAGMEQMGSLVGVSRAAAIVSGALMVVWAASNIATLAGVQVRSPRRFTALAWPQRTLGSMLLRVRDAQPATRACAVGVLTTLLPCGWLYAFVATAAGTGSALAGAGTMLVFWLGTVPMLLVVGLSAQRALGRFARRLPLASAVFVLVLGVLAIAGKMQPPSHATGAWNSVSHTAAAAPHAH